MLGRQSFKGRVVIALWVLIAPLAGSGCGEPVMAPADPSATTQGSPVGAPAGAAREMCVTGRPSEEGIECQAFRTDDGRLYTLVGDLGSLPGDGDVCVCGQPAEMSTCMQGTTISVTRIGPPDTCP